MMETMEGWRIMFRQLKNISSNIGSHNYHNISDSAVENIEAYNNLESSATMITIKMLCLKIIKNLQLKMNNAKTGPHSSPSRRTKR